MPQMAPLMWMNLMIIFISTFLIINSINYFSFNYNSKNIKMIKKVKLTNWKW
uniref:ATP synthase complex subunit 8 n=1 Tax=Rhagophthalmus ohbai TaxID=71225 RepID=A4PCG5_9COLE|nr:ATP synthase F0 subunit 8 [Rhagophthalmus ohbai]BAF52862.1 ATP synthase F0 subunit 8 [Rhagophthalmus ohbai]